jgi:hypothetical protein
MEADLKAALLTEFQGVRQQVDPAPIVVQPPVKESELKRRQLGPAVTDRPQCRKWTEGLWTAAMHGSGGTWLAATLLLDPHQSLTRGLFVSEAIIAGPATLLDGLMDSRLPPECAKARIATGAEGGDSTESITPTGWGTVAISPVPAPKAGDASWAFLMTGATGQTMSAVFRSRTVVVQVTLVYLHSAPVPQMEMVLHQLAQQALTRVRSSLP